MATPITARGSRKPREKSGEEREEKVKLCGKCCKDAVKDSIGCEICERVFHCKCEEVAPSTYKILMQEKSLHWYCTGCSKGVVNTWKRLKERQEELEDEVRKVREELKAVFNEIAPKIEQLEDKAENDRTRIMKLEKAVEGIAAEFKKETTDAENKVDSILKVKIDESLQEENEKKERKSNVILFGVAESEAVEAKDRIQNDMEEVEHLLKSIRCEGKIKQLIRLGKKPEKAEEKNEEGVEETKPRPLKVVFCNDETKNEVLLKARELRSTKNAHVFIVQDLTPKERQQRKLLVEERNRRRAAGEDVIIHKDKVVTRWKRVVSNQ